MVETPLTYEFSISAEQLAKTPEEARLKRIKIVLRRAIPKDAFLTLSLIILEKAGVAYTLNDGVIPADSPESKGIIAEDGVLIHQVSARAKGCTIMFEGDPEPLELVFDQSSIEEALEAEEEGSWHDESLEEDWDFKIEDLLEGDEDEEDERVLTLLIEEMKGREYTLIEQGGSNLSSTGTVDEDGYLIHPISQDATGCTIKFGQGEDETIELSFSTSNS